MRLNPNLTMRDEPDERRLFRQMNDPFFTLMNGRLSRSAYRRSHGRKQFDAQHHDALAFSSMER